MGPRYSALGPIGGPSTLRVTCLASGSSGNSLLIQLGDRAVLVDAGLSIRKLTSALVERGLGPGSLDAVLITHEHVDHIRSADLLSHRYEAPVLGNPATLRALRSELGPLDLREFATGSSTSAGVFEIASFPVSHDALDPVGYVISCGGVKVTVMTDLGDLTPELLEPVRTSSLVVLEANHDIQRLLDGPYPQRLKRRILSHLGHLSNRQSAELIAEGLSNRPQAFWLAHLSRTNNTRTQAVAEVRGFLAAHGLTADVKVTERDRPSLVWEPPRTDVQLSLFGAIAG
ncbi:MAG: MBL fold metallo-hydrolase [Chloroflexota bacterium]|nr:MBL fold metallo-hydrolase [Chloroflexota bacterium]